MARMATRVMAKAMLAGVAAFAGASAVAQPPARQHTPGPVIAQAGAAPEFRAQRPLRLAPTEDGPTSDAPLSFGRRLPDAPAVARSAPAGGMASPATAPQSPVASKVATAPATTPQAEAAPALAPRAEPTPTPPPQAGATPLPAPSAAVPASPASPHAGAKRDDEARALARLRARLEETLTQHSGVDARVKAQRNALRVVSHGPTEPPRRTSVSGAGNPVASRAASRARGPAQASSKRLAGTTPRDWSYRGETGPEHWASLNPEWAACGADIPQAPIDIRDGIAVGLPPIEFDLPPAQLTIRDDGRAIRAVVREGPGIVTLGRRFELREITFHQPAEFRVEGKAFDLSAHLLHRDEQGRAAVVVVLFELGDESTPRNPVVQTVLDYLPLARDMLMPVPERKELNALLPADPGYYNFVGALSSPPCTEGVVWMVMREPVPIPPSQVAIFARVHPMNVRPLQPLAGRLIKQSE